MDDKIIDKEKKAYHHKGLRDTLIEAPLSELREKSSAEISLRQVARRAGVSHTAPYRHFKDMAALLAAIAEQKEISRVVVDTVMRGVLNS